MNSYILIYERTEQAKALRRIYGEHTPIGRSNLRQWSYRRGYSNTISTVTKDNFLLEVEEYKQ